jgi:hypothetical protein
MNGCGNTASWDAVGSNRNVIRLHKSQTVEQVALHRQITSQGTGLDKVHNPDVAKHQLQHVPLHYIRATSHDQH